MAYLIVRDAICFPPSGCTSMWLLRRYRTHEPAGFEVFCLQGIHSSVDRVSGLLTTLVLPQFGAPLVQCATREVRFVVWNCWLGPEQGGCSLLPLDALSAFLRGGSQLPDCCRMTGNPKLDEFRLRSGPMYGLRRSPVQSCTVELKARGEE